MLRMAGWSSVNSTAGRDHNARCSRGILCIQGEVEDESDNSVGGGESTAGNRARYRLEVEAALGSGRYGTASESSLREVTRQDLPSGWKAYWPAASTAGAAPSASSSSSSGKYSTRLSSVIDSRDGELTVHDVETLLVDFKVFVVL